MFTLSENHDRFIIPAVTATETRWLGRDEVDDRFDALFATLHATGLILDRLILLFEYGGKYGPLEAAELADQPLDW